MGCVKFSFLSSLWAPQLMWYMSVVIKWSCCIFRYLKGYFIFPDTHLSLVEFHFWQQHTHLFLYILSVIFLVDIRFWHIIFHSQSMVPDLHRQTLKQQNMPQVNILKNFKVKDVCTCPNSWLRASDCVRCKMVPSSIPNGVDAKGLKKQIQGRCCIFNQICWPSYGNYFISLQCLL